VVLLTEHTVLPLSGNELVPSHGLAHNHDRMASDPCSRVETKGFPPILASSVDWDRPPFFTTRKFATLNSGTRYGDF